MHHSKRVMRLCLVFGGVVFVLRGIKACGSIVSELASVHISSAYAVGQITGEAVAALGLLAAGIALIMLAQPRRGDVPSREPSA